MGQQAGEPIPASEPARRQIMLQNGMAAGRAGAWEWDATTKHMRCTAMIARVFGLTPEEGFAGVPFERLLAAVHPEDREDLEDLVADVRENGGLFATEYRTCPAAGTEYRIQAQGHYELDPTGVVVCAAGVILDVSEATFDPEPADPFANLLHALGEAHAALNKMAGPVQRFLDPALRELVERVGLIAQLVDIRRANGRP